MDLLEALRRPEGKTLEFKRDLSSPDGVLRTIVAFANTAGGTLLVGVEDGTRRVRGVREPLGVEERLANLVSDSIEPRLLPDLEILPWRRTHVLLVQVHPSGSRPHCLRREGLSGGVYVRVGSTNRRADDQLVEELRRFARGVSFDEQPLPEAGPDAIDFGAARAAFAPRRRLRRADLETLRLVTVHQGRPVSTVAGIVLFGSDRERHFPDAWMQVGRFRGVDRAGILDHREIHELPLRAIEAAVGFVRKHADRAAEIGAVRRLDRWSLPPVAVREAIVNAVVHADYAQRGTPIRVALFDDRLEVESPGLLPFGLTIEDVQRGVSKLRNRSIGRVFRELGLIEQWGSGIQRMTQACRDAGLPAPLFEELGNRFRVTLRTERIAEAVTDSRDQAILDALGRSGGLSTRHISGAISLTPRATRTRLAGLVDRGFVREVGTSPRDPKRLYVLAGSHPREERRR